MLCPRCGQEAEGMARACPSCGYILPFSMRQRNTARQVSQQLPSAAALPQPAPQGIPESAATIPHADPILTGPDTTQEMVHWLFPDAPAKGAAITRPLPPTLRPTYGAERESTLTLPTVHPEPTGAGGVSEALPPLPALPDFPEPGMSGSVPLSAITGVTRAPSDATGSMVALGTGTLMKGGRYRLLHRFGAPNDTSRRAEPEPPLFLASDTERPSGRVLIQELPVTTMRPDLAEQVLKQVVSRFEQVGTIAGLPTLVDSFTERRRRFLVFAIPPGETLAERLKHTTTLSQPEVIRLGLNVLDVLAQMERASPPMTHGNISADHVILEPGGQVRLVGFSPTLLVQGRGQQRAAVAGGVRGYAAPEQQRGQADARTDIYALAVVLSYALTGKDPGQISGPLHESVRQTNAAISPELDAILAQALRPAPAQRYQSADEMRQALAPLAPAPAITQRPAVSPTRGRPSAPTSGPAHRLPGAAGALRAALVERPRLAARKPALTWVVVVALLLLGIAGGSLMYAARLRQPVVMAIPTATIDQAAVVLYQQKGIGLSAGELIFDRKRVDGDLKRQGARALAAHNLQAALADFRQAMAIDRADAEAAIYAADVSLTLGHDPVATIVVGVAFGSDASAAESELQGVYLAQQQANALDLLPGTTRLRVLIANSGAAPADAATVGEMVARAVAAGNAQHIVGVVGWPAASQTAAAARSLTAAGLPIIAPAPAIPDVRSPNYFALAPSSIQEGSALADAAATVLNSQRVFVLADPATPLSATMSTAFTTQATQAYASSMVITRQEAYTQGQTTDFSQAVRDALSSRSDTILITGSDADVVFLAQAVAHLAPQYGATPHILAAAQANTPTLLGVGESPVARLARSQPAMMASVDVMALAATGEWTAVGVPQGLQPTFATDYATQFGRTAAPGGLAAPDATAILAFDGMEMLSRAVARAAHTEALPAPAAVTAALSAIKGSGFFQGIGGAIVYSGSGAPIGKALALDSLRPIDSAPANGPALDAVVIAVVGGQAAFCGGADCVAP